MLEGSCETGRRCTLEASGKDSQGYFDLRHREKWVGLGCSTFQVEKIEPMALRRARDTTAVRPALSWQRLGLGGGSELNART